MYPIEVRFNTGFRGARLAQAVSPVLPSMPSTPSAPSGGPLAVGLLGAGLVLVLGTVGVLFNYGIARESKSKLVKYTGYTVAGVGALSTLIGVVGMAMGAGQK